MKRILHVLRHQFGLLTSLAMYYWQPGKLAQLGEFFQAYLPADALCFDVGAHLGNRTKVWRKLGATVVAIEPQAICLKYLRRRFGNDPKVTILPVAVSSQAGTTQMHVSAMTPTITTLAGQEWQDQMQALSKFKLTWDYSVEVETVTLQNVVETYGVPDFCKIDVEDLELEVLTGLSTPIPLLSFEYMMTRIEKTVHCIERLQEIGNYEFNRSEGESHHLLSTHWLSGKAMTEQLTVGNEQVKSGDIYARIIAGDS